jgi:hypothetical protein
MEGNGRGGGVNPPTFLKLIYSENRVSHSENYAQNMRIFVWKLRLHFPDSKHFRGFAGHGIFGNFFRHSEIFGLHPPPQLYMLATAQPPRRQHFREKFFRCPFHSKSAPRNRAPIPPIFYASYAPERNHE